MSLALTVKVPMQLWLKPVGFDKTRFEYELNPVDDSPPVSQRVGARLFVTDYISPSAETRVGLLLKENMQRLHGSGSPQFWPKQKIDLFEIPSAYVDVAAVVVAGSPAGHRPEGGQCSTGCASFKQDVFYSMCWRTWPLQTSSSL